MAEALYRKYRPQVFEEVVGQEPIERTLKNALAQDKVSHAYLFCGPRGTGKTTTARLLSKALLCEKGPTPDPDGTCEDCELIAAGVHPDVYELDAASRTGVDNVREEIIGRVHFAPTRGRYKVYIIDEVHMLSNQAFNALLKTLEEPPPHVVFILCTTDPQKVPETIHSRCQRFDFHRISQESMVARLGAVCVAENVEFEGEALDLIAQRAQGGLRDALTSLEQIIAFENGSVTLAGAERLLGSIDSNDMAEIIELIGRRDIAGCFRFTANYVETGSDLAQFVRDMAEHVRNLYVMALAGDDAQLEVSETSRRELAAELAWFGPDRAARLLGVLGELISELKTASNPRLSFEVALTRMVRPDSDLTLEALAERVEALESGYSAVAHVLPGSSAVVPAASSLPSPGAAVPASQAEGVHDASYADSSANAGSDVVTGVTTEAGSKASLPDARAGVSAQVQQVTASESSQVGEEGQTSQRADAGFSEVAPTGVSASGARLGALANPAALQRVWHAVLTGVKKRKPAYGVLFMGTKARFDAAAGKIIVTFAADSSFTLNTARKREVQEMLAEEIAKAVGEPVTFEYEKASESIAQGADPNAAAAPAVEAASTDIPVQAVADSARISTSAPTSSPEENPATATAATQPPQGVAESGSETVPAATAYGNETSDDALYEQVPYEDIDARQPYISDADAGASSGARYLEQDRVVQALSPSSDRRGGRDGAAEASGSDPAALQAMLQASFGASVVLSETDE